MSDNEIYHFPTMQESFDTQNYLATKNYTYTGSSNGSVDWHCVYNAKTTIPQKFKSDPLLAGKVTAVENFGWMKFVIPKDGKYKVTCLGASGGNTGSIDISPSNGAITGTGNRPGRGAKLIGTCELRSGDVLYIAVGHRGQPMNNSSGAIGGGATVILLKNSSGSYTFQPTNEKVSVLMCAAGGGGAGYSSTTNANYYGKDAVLTNATTTTAGATNSGNATGGSGLTQAPTSCGYGPNTISLLSGGIGLTAGNARYSAYGAWPGGGNRQSSKPYGGGGSGYKGGDAGSGSSAGGSGGQCFVDTTRFTDIVRDYPKATDTDLGVTNPWAAAGHIVIEFCKSRDEGKMILASDSDGYKWFNGEEDISGTKHSDATDEWELLPDQSTPQPDTYREYGNRIITSVLGLKNNVRFLIQSNQPQEQIEVVGNINAAWIKQTNSISLADVSLIKSISLVSTNLTSLDVRFAVSKNDGNTYQTYSAGEWVDINVDDKDDFMNSAYSLSNFSAIPIEHWNNYAPKTIRFLFCVTQLGPNDGSILGYINTVVDLVGSWRHFKESEATYEYVSDTDFKVTFLQAGNYKVNYLDSLNSESSES